MQFVESNVMNVHIWPKHACFRLLLILNVTETLSKVNNEVLKHHCTLSGIVCDGESQFDDCNANIYVRRATTYKRANERKHVRTYVRGHICMCVCMYVRMYVCTYVCTYVCLYVRTYVSMYVCMYVCMYVRMYACMYVCMYVCV